MTKMDLEDLEKKVMEEVVNRRRLGGFDANAGTILLLSEWMLKIVQHLNTSQKK